MVYDELQDIIDAAVVVLVYGWEADLRAWGWDGQGANDSYRAAIAAKHAHAAAQEVWYVQREGEA